MFCFFPFLQLLFYCIEPYYGESFQNAVLVDRGTGAKGLGTSYKLDGLKAILRELKIRVWELPASCTGILFDMVLSENCVGALATLKNRAVAIIPMKAVAIRHVESIESSQRIALVDTMPEGVGKKVSYNREQFDLISKDCGSFALLLKADTIRSSAETSILIGKLERRMEEMVRRALQNGSGIPLKYELFLLRDDGLTDLRNMIKKPSILTRQIRVSTILDMVGNLRGSPKEKEKLVKVLRRIQQKKGKGAKVSDIKWNVHGTTTTTSSSRRSGGLSEVIVITDDFPENLKKKKKGKRRKKKGKKKKLQNISGGGEGKESTDKIEKRRKGN